MAFLNTLSTSYLSVSRSSLGTGAALDEFGQNALFGYSLRKVRDDADKCVRVRRDSDNTEQDIGFNGDSIDIAALESFIEGASAYVKIWYQQLGGTSHFAAVTNTQQPPIAENGSVLTDPVMGLPCIRFNGGRYLEYTATGGNYSDSSGWSVETFNSLTSEYSIFFIGQSYKVTGTANIFEGSTSSNSLILSDDSISYRVNGSGATLSLPDDGFTNLYAWEAERDASNGLGLFKNNTDLITTTTTQSGTFEIQKLGEGFGGDVFEILGYSASQDERDALFENLDEYYTITDYAHTPTTYTNAFAARVAADGGSVESTSCLITDLTPLV